MPTHSSFDVKRVQLEGSNLIEASAGTGKTYSIAILVLRLVLEKQIPVEKILMVTFTKAAIAELESRIRKFLRKAYKYACGTEIDDATIKEVVGVTNPDKVSLLREAVESLDSLSVMTIHSFCQQVISQYPFETRESFDAELMTDTGDLIMSFVNNYWRSELNTLANVDIFKQLTNTLTRDKLKNVINKSLDDKEFVFEAADKQTVLDEIALSIRNIELAENAYINHITTNWDTIIGQGGNNKYSNNFINKYNNPEAFAIAFHESAKKPPVYFSTCFPNELALVNTLQGASDISSDLFQKYVNIIYSELIEKVKTQIKESKKAKGIITYDDLITKLHQAIMDNRVNELLLKQYDVAFIDEFQDTDRKQYEIFSRLFNEHRIVFYIGDPKQSIYGWRKADINTYKKARNGVHSIHSMNRNFRSTEELIKGMNAFFGIVDPFYDTEIGYTNVENGASNLGAMTENNQNVVPVAINHFNSNIEIIPFVTQEILRLLTDKSILIKKDRIRPGDIAVLARSNFQAKEIKKALSAINVPSITIDDTSILQSDEAQLILTLMNGVLQPNHGTINKILFNNAFGFNLEQVNSLDDEVHVEIFRSFRIEWFDNGIYNMLSSAFDKYNVRTNCLSNGIAGQRTLSNFYQLAELLNQKTLETKYSPEELILWMQREKENKSDGYEQRIESEDNAVQISTVHRAKGLTYKIVFAPFLDLTIKEYEFIDFREGDAYKFTTTPTDEQMELYKKQNEQENRRLIYVALTRAQYKNYICINSYFKESSIRPFLVTQFPLFELNVVKEPTLSRYTTQAVDQQTFSPRPTPTIRIKNNFGIHSFSGLSNAHFTAPFTNEELNGDYNRFIFQTLGRGANVGTALHSIFEHLNFSDEASWEQTIIDASKYYSNIIKEDAIPHFLQLVKEVMTTEIGTSDDKFNLQSISKDQKLPELEFLFSVENVNKTAVARVLATEANLNGEADIEGLMTGFIDLVFEHNGKFYILDWKSNHLGNSIESYNEAGMEEAMTGSNYHLQYLIYTVAMKRYLAQKIINFDYDTHFGGVIYVFMRGVRCDGNTGIYYKKPSSKSIIELDEIFRK